MIITEVGTAHVPVEIFGFQVKGEHVGENCVHCSRDVPGRGTCEIGRRRQWSFPSAPKFRGPSRIRFVHGLVSAVGLSSTRTNAFQVIPCLPVNFVTCRFCKFYCPWERVNFPA